MDQNQGNYVAPMPASTSVSTSTPTVATEPIQPKNNKNKIGMIIGIACLALLAVAGLSFGVYATTTKDAAVAEATAGCAANKPAGAPEEKSDETPEDTSDINEVTCPDGTTIEVEVPSVANPSEYIIIGSWGVKIKIPSDLVSVSYQFNVGAGYTGLSVLGAKRGGHYFPEFADPLYNKSGLGVIRRLPEDYTDEWYTGANAVLTLDGYKYYYSHPQGLYSVDEDEIKWEAESTALIQQMLSNANNYSKI